MRYQAQAFDRYGRIVCDVPFEATEPRAVSMAATIITRTTKAGDKTRCQVKMGGFVIHRFTLE